MSIETNASKIIHQLFLEDKKTGIREYSGEEVQEFTGLTPEEINDAVEILADRGLLKRLTWKGTLPYRFGQINVTSRGRYFVEQILQDSNEKLIPTDKLALNELIKSQPIAAGSPYGFTDMDWEYTQLRIKDNRNLYVIFGHQFDSTFYNTTDLARKLKQDFQRSIDRYNQETDSVMELRFKQLSAGYGEHLFNQIARDIISSDIAIFETSDLNPNVMIELGVALTWGKRVFPIKVSGQPKPPSDISGQTYADYKDNGCFIDTEHDEKLYRMVERAIQNKL